MAGDGGYSWHGEGYEIADKGPEFRGHELETVPAVLGPGEVIAVREELALGGGDKGGAILFFSDPAEGGPESADEGRIQPVLAGAADREHKHAPSLLQCAHLSLSLCEAAESDQVRLSPEALDAAIMINK